MVVGIEISSIGAHYWSRASDQNIVACVCNILYMCNVDVPNEIISVRIIAKLNTYKLSVWRVWRVEARRVVYITNCVYQIQYICYGSEMHRRGTIRLWYSYTVVGSASRIA